MGWKGTLRSVNATLRAMEREAQRRERERQKYEKQLAREEEVAAAEAAVADYEDYINRLTTLHQSTPNVLKWTEFLESKPPVVPERYVDRQSQALKQRNNYKPSLLDQLLNRAGSKIEKLDSAIADAIRADEEQYKKAIQAHARATEKWQQDKQLAQLAIKGDPKALKAIASKYGKFETLSEIGTSLSFRFSEMQLPHAHVEIHGEDAIPKEQLTLLKSGKLSTKQLPKSKYYSLFQDHVCSVILRIANELLSILPIERIIVTAFDEVLNTATGHICSQPILSVDVPRATLSKLNLSQIDPSDALRNFNHNMSFKATKGFNPIKPLSNL